jgi:Helix-turn-helix domain
MKNATLDSDKSAYLSVRDAATYLGVSIYFVYRLLGDVDGPPHVELAVLKKARPMIRIPKKEFFEWVKKNER